MPVYSSHSIETTAGEVVLLKFVESMLARDDEDLVVDKLKGDIVLELRTISGKEHAVSMNGLNDALGKEFANGESLAIAVIDKWSWIHKP